MRLVIAGDSVGEELAQALFTYLKAQGNIDVETLPPVAQGAGELYPQIAERVCLAILDGKYDRGVLCCGTGIGMSISANKVHGIRAALTHDAFSAQRAAKSNDAHIITLGSRVIGLELAKHLVDTWLSCTFDPAGPSAKNVEAISALDDRYSHSEKISKNSTACL